MLDRIQNNNLDTINQGQTLEKINSIGATNPFEKEDYTNYLIDESDISSSALQKYQRELDVQKFSAILKETDQNEANKLVIQNILDGNFELDSGFMDSLLKNENFLNDILKQN